LCDATGPWERLSKALRPAAGNVEANAAVSLLLRPIDKEFKILVVKRVENPRDPWSGQMALPGGRREPQDQDLKQTAIRETMEETGINLLDRSRFLGVLDVYRSTVRPEMRIIPFVVLLEHEPTVKLNRGELESWVWVTPKQLAENRGSARFSFGVLPVYRIGGNMIWGMTYSVLTSFTQLLHDALQLP
jgi:8-oxo-dGTP pyrophosphatase MutT (NUDIX family)